MPGPYTALSPARVHHHHPDCIPDILNAIHFLEAFPCNKNENELRGLLATVHLGKHRGDYEEQYEGWITIGSEGEPIRGVELSKVMMGIWGVL